MRVGCDPGRFPNPDLHRARMDMAREPAGEDPAPRPPLELGAQIIGQRDEPVLAALAPHMQPPIVTDTRVTHSGETVERDTRHLTPLGSVAIEGHVS